MFMVWTIVNAHYPALFVPGLLFYLAFAQVTSPYQNNIDLKSPLLVGFFIGGLLIHGGVQGWWIEPVLGSLAEAPLMLTATILTALNDNAAITYLSTLIPGLSDGMKYAVVAGAVTGGGLTVIANAPNPAGRSILNPHFKNGVSPSKLLLAALGPTVVVGLVFLII
jgi:Na+/H+ antiporter NhaD/arsenite permease-like protein